MGKSYNLPPPPCKHDVEGIFSSLPRENENTGMQVNKNEEKCLSISFQPKENLSERGISFFGATAQFVIIMISTNPLTIPAAFRSLGLVYGLCGFFIIGCISTYGLLMISHVSNHFRQLDGVKGRSLYQVAERSMRCLPVFQDTSFPKIFGTTISIIVILNLIAVLTMFVTLTVESFKQLLLSFNQTEIGFKTIILSLMPIFASICLIRNPRIITSVSAIGSTCVICGLSASLIFVIRHLIHNGVGSIDVFKDFHNFPEFLGVIVFAFGGTILVVPIENTMAQPQKMYQSLSVIILTMIITSVVLLLCGLLGYLAYGTSTQPQLNLHLPTGAVETIILQLLLSIGIIFSCPVLYGAIMEQGLSYFSEKPPLHLEILLRFIVVFFTFLLPLLLESNVLKVIQWLSPTLALLQYVVPPLMTLPTFWNVWSLKQRIIQTLVAFAMIGVGLLSFASLLNVF